ncbi:hypothetical protein RIF29_09388 [Crotalaria pallida]|uniref:Uncharacterized protein n=1 Tax=Crotalaria pallida TaxID=3830 RepID=A0AAN9FRR7_CROPI
MAAAALPMTGPLRLSLRATATATAAFSLRARATKQPRSSLLASPASAAGSDRATAATGPCVPDNATYCLCSLSSFNLDMETIRTKEDMYYAVGHGCYVLGIGLMYVGLWLQHPSNIVSKTRIWCKKYPSMELRGLFQYLVNQLKKRQGIELVLLQIPFVEISFVANDLKIDDRKRFSHKVLYLIYFPICT